MDFIVKGADAKTGVDRTERFSADDEKTAIAMAKSRGLFVASVKMVGSRAAQPASKNPTVKRSATIPIVAGVIVLVAAAAVTLVIIKSGHRASSDSDLHRLEAENEKLKRQLAGAPASIAPNCCSSASNSS